MSEKLWSLPVVSWALYDFANTIFSLNIVSLYFALWISTDLQGGEYLFPPTFALSMLAVALVAPFLGHLAGLAWWLRRKRHIITFSRSWTPKIGRFESTTRRATTPCSRGPKSTMWWLCSGGSPAFRSSPSAKMGVGPSSSTLISSSGRSRGGGLFCWRWSSINTGNLNLRDLPADKVAESPHRE